jgi:hypothetical protein
MLGLQGDGGELAIDPHVPDEVGEIYYHGLHALGTHYDVRAAGREGTIEVTS